MKKLKIKKKVIDPCSVPVTRWEYATLRFIRIIGYVVGYILVYYFYLTLYNNGVFKPKCPIGDNGMECNGGICEYGFCKCTNVLYSGISCSDTACPKNSLGQICSNHGFCSPFINKTEIPDVCKWEHPSIENNFKPTFTNGWNSEKCKTYISENQNGIGIPQCSCRIPYVGSECNIESSCPRDLKNRICSGYGNSSVTYTNNQTTIGNGCQCRNIINFLDDKYISTYSMEMLMIIKDFYFDDFQQLYCADNIYDFTNLNVTDNAYQCHCDELHYGNGCQFGKCPGEIPCSGNGHDMYGFGYISNTSIKTNTTIPICLDGLKYCENDKTCRFKCIQYPSISKNTYRCISGTIAMDTSDCARYSQDGYLDIHTRDDKKVCKAPNCEMYGISTVYINETMKLSIKSMMKFFSFTIENTSPFSEYSVELMINNEILFRKQIAPNSIEIFSDVPQLNYEQLSRKLFKESVYQPVYVILDHFDIYKMFPLSESFNDKTFRLQNK